MTWPSAIGPRSWDEVDLPPGLWELPHAEWEAALDRLDIELREALEMAVTRVREYHWRQRDNGFTLLEEDGSILAMRVAPLRRVGLYIPAARRRIPPA